MAGGLTSVYIATDGRYFKIGVAGNVARRISKLRPPMVQDERPPGRVSLVQSWYRPALATQIEVSVKVTFRNMGKVVFGSEWFGVTQEEMMKETEHIIQAIDRIGAERWNEGR